MTLTLLPQGRYDHLVTFKPCYDLSQSDGIQEVLVGIILFTHHGNAHAVVAGRFKVVERVHRMETIVDVNKCSLP